MHSRLNAAEMLAKPSTATSKLSYRESYLALTVSEDVTAFGRAKMIPPTVCFLRDPSFTPR